MQSFWLDAKDPNFLSEWPCVFSLLINSLLETIKTKTREGKCQVGIVMIHLCDKQRKDVMPKFVYEARELHVLRGPRYETTLAPTEKLYLNNEKNLFKC